MSIFFHILLFVVLVHNNYWFVPHGQLCFLLQMVIYYAFYHLSFIYFVDFLAIQHLMLFQ